jgi:hypothetical protein
MCTASGTDADFLYDCSTVMGFPDNKAGCFTTNCSELKGQPYMPGSAMNPGPACCRATQPVCIANFTSPSPTTYNGTYYSFATNCALVGNSFQVGLDLVGGQYALYLSAGLGALQPGQTASWTSLNNPTGCINGTCCSYTGTLTLNSSAPAWSVTVNLTCPTNSALNIVGTASGNY